MAYKGRLVGFLCVAMITGIFIPYELLVRGNVTWAMVIVLLPTFLALAHYCGYQHDKLRQMASAMKVHQQQLQESNDKLEAIFHGAGMGIFMLDSKGKFVFSNPQTREMLGYQEEELHQMTIFEVGHSEDAEYSAHLLEQIVKNEAAFKELERRYVKKNGETLWAKASAYPFCDKKGATLAIGMLVDITALKQIERELRRANQKNEKLAYQDPLTGLANRRAFNRYMRNGRRKNGAFPYPTSLLMMDVDFFKTLNDHYGHLTGDDCLSKVARTINQTVTQKGGLVARYGGEEFAAVLPGINETDALLVAETIRQAVEALAIPHAQSKAGNVVTISAGCASKTSEEEPVSEWIQRADRALYEAKAAGRNQVRSSESKKAFSGNG